MYQYLYLTSELLPLEMKNDNGQTFVNHGTKSITSAHVMSVFVVNFLGQEFTFPMHKSYAFSVLPVIVLLFPHSTST